MNRATTRLVLLFFAAIWLRPVMWAAVRLSAQEKATPSFTNSIGMKLVLIPSGEFMMGSTETAEALLKEFPQYDRTKEFFSDELPRHRVRITRPFYFGKYEVANGDFRKFVDAIGYKTQ